MRKATWLIAAVLVLALSVTSALAMTVIYDRFNSDRNEGVCLVKTSPNNFWLVHYRDSGSIGRPGVFDMTDTVLSRERVRVSIGGR